jgi:tRNA-2-methylthio-N6-dimethylallyladenosine synthase
MTDLPSTASSPQKKVHIETWGCQMNVADSEKMLSLLQGERYELTDSPESADLVVMNTCHIREKARHKVLSRLGVLNEIKQSKPGLKIAVTGCVAQADGKKLLELAPQIDVLLGPGKIDDLPRLLRESADTNRSMTSLGFDRHSEEKDGHEHAHGSNAASAPSITGKPEVSRYVNIIQGCNNFCTFCVVPFTRGREISRPLAEVLSEASDLVAKGAKEITLLGQNVNSYGLDLLNTDIVPDDGGPFVKLLVAVAAIPGLERLRFTTSNPHDFTMPLAGLFAAQPKLGRYIHLPVQAGNDRTLARMKRKVTVAEYLEKVQWLREQIPDVAISTDLIVGFPGETEEEFQGTLNLVEQCQFSFIFAFKYSPRKGTAAARFADQIDEKTMDERLARLNALQDRITTKLNQAEIGQVREVLFIYESAKEPGIFVGRTPHFRTVRVRSKINLIGKTSSVMISGANKVALVGDVLEQNLTIH